MLKTKVNISKIDEKSHCLLNTCLLTEEYVNTVEVIGSIPKPDTNASKVQKLSIIMDRCKEFTAVCGFIFETLNDSLMKTPRFRAVILKGFTNKQTFFCAI